MFFIFLFLKILNFLINTFGNSEDNWRNIILFSVLKSEKKICKSIILSGDISIFKHG